VPSDTGVEDSMRARGSGYAPRRAHGKWRHAACSLSVSRLSRASRRRSSASAAHMR
jgi:hypothetical protein